MNERSRALTALANERWRISLWLTIAMLTIYFGFILLIAYDKELLGFLITPGLSLGILLGALVIVAAWILIYIYIRWSNNYYDKKLAELREDEQ